MRALRAREVYPSGRSRRALVLRLLPRPLEQGLRPFASAPPDRFGVGFVEASHRTLSANEPQVKTGIIRSSRASHLDIIYPVVNDVLARVQRARGFPSRHRVTSPSARSD